jgi:hypothetical protein
MGILFSQESPIDDQQLMPVYVQQDGDDKLGKRREQFIQFIKKNYAPSSWEGLIQVYDEHPDKAWRWYFNKTPPNSLEKFIMGVK